MIFFNNLYFDISTDFNNLDSLLSKELNTKCYNSKLKRLSVDARFKIPKYCCSVTFCCNNEEKIIGQNKNAKKYTEKEYNFLKAKHSNIKPIVIGFGPAGMFAALILAKSGLKPIVFEQGKPVEDRAKDINDFWKNGNLNEQSNVQFGEGGAGTFSDGKLNTGIKDDRIDFVLKTYCFFGANKNILYDAKPHIGTDVLINVVKNMREEIINLGGEIHFNSKATEFIIEKNNGTEYRLKGVVINNKEKYLSDFLVLAIGNAARDTFKILNTKNFKLSKKPFSIGVRIEHKQEFINKALYRQSYKQLPPADYKMAVHLTPKNNNKTKETKSTVNNINRGVYTFCMCPGGYVINGASCKNSVVTNGMSNQKRDNINANSALLVSVYPEDLKNDNVLAGMELQEKIEKNAFNLTGGYGAPAQKVGDFLKSKKTESFGSVKPSIRPFAVPSKLNRLFPEFIVKSLKEALLLFDKKIKGFADENAVLTAPETRSSCPVRIDRNENMESNIKGVFPCGEGSGYAGGIMSSAVDGIKAAENIIKSINNY